MSKITVAPFSSFFPLSLLLLSRRSPLLRFAAGQPLKTRRLFLAVTICVGICTMLSLASPTACGFAAPLAPRSAARSTPPVMETIDDLKSLAVKANPVVGYWRRA